MSDEPTLRIEHLGGSFNFQVGRERFMGRASYVVQLPHSCDEWVIADEEDKATAVARVETFIAEATAALEWLRQTP